MMADIFNKPILLLDTSETGCRGAALYAGVGIGAYDSCAEASERAVHITAKCDPDPETAEAYDSAYSRFTEAYEALEKRVFR
jgi:xylulokinase